MLNSPILLCSLALLNLLNLTSIQSKNTRLQCVHFTNTLMDSKVGGQQAYPSSNNNTALNCSPIFLTMLHKQHLSQYFISVNDGKSIWLLPFSPGVPKERARGEVFAFSHSLSMTISQYGLQSPSLTLTQTASICQDLFCVMI